MLPLISTFSPIKALWVLMVKYGISLVSIDTKVHTEINVFYTGVAHREEINYLWNKRSNIDNAPQEDILTRNRLVRLWTNFAKTG